jgi:hypothetical protein
MLVQSAFSERLERARWLAEVGGFYGTTERDQARISHSLSSAACSLARLCEIFLGGRNRPLDLGARRGT